MTIDSFLNCDLATKISIGLLVIAVPIMIILLFLPAWYGRYSTSKKHILGTIPAKLGWILQESPSLLIPFICIMCDLKSVKANYVNIICLGFYMFHYAYRSFIYPFRIRNGKNIPTEIFLMAITFCILNGYIQAVYHLSPCVTRNVSWLYDPRFILGAIIFITGMGINWQSDYILRSLRADHSTGYKIPHGGMFEYISGANYFGECVEWIGYAILTWNLAGTTFAVFTIANVGPRAIQHHKWYKQTFGDEYPAKRKALIPFILFSVSFQNKH